MDSAECGYATHLVKKNMALVSKENFITSVTVGEHTNQVPHGSTRNENCGFFSHSAGSSFFKTIDSWVFAENIISDLCLGHRFTHGFCWLGQRIAS
jgi:hypothetical protein